MPLALMHDSATKGQRSDALRTELNSINEGEGVGAMTIIDARDPRGWPCQLPGSLENLSIASAESDARFDDLPLHFTSCSNGRRADPFFADIRQLSDIGT